ncbi:MAG: class I SAM-dependent methyltransferase [Candidatus Caenarcaniphilales bacterium]|nr:class I SAM-dependent methyltransferase [Candidatus Caenarcaniphilales bacterium]
MSDFRNELTDYICSTFKLEDSLLENIIKQQSEAGGPMMNIGADQGKFINLLVQMSKSREILEVGSYFGYSSVWFGRALKALQDRENCEANHYSLTCVEKSGKQIPIIENNLKKAGLEALTEVINADARAHLDKLIQEERVFDLMFIDADKGNYPTYFKQAEKLVKPGGLLLVDNVLGLHTYEVLDSKTEDKRILAIQEFNKLLAESHSFDGSILTVQAGLAIAIKH